MLVERLRREWLDRERTAPITEASVFTADGLVMGANTVLVPANGKRRLNYLEDGQSRLQALLSVAYNRAVTPKIIAQIDRAARCWARGDDCLALIHLSLAGLHRVEDRQETARRLFMADGLMKAGVAPHAIIDALDLRPAEEPFQRYSDSQLRVPKGSGETSGQWTKTGSILARLSVAAAEFLGMAALNIARVAAANPYAFTLGFILIPRGNDLEVSGDVPELPGLRFAWNREEATLHLAYQGPNGATRDILATLDPDGNFHDGDRVVAKLLPDHTLAIDPGEISSDLADKDGPNLCPTPGPDKRGRLGAGGEKDKDYEDQIKLLINPDNPTPRGYGYVFYNPITGDRVFIDDCHHPTGSPVEIKGEYDQLLFHDFGANSLGEDWLDQSKRQIQATEGHELFRVFAETGSAHFAANLFADAKQGRERIQIAIVPRVGAAQ